MRNAHLIVAAAVVLTASFAIADDGHFRGCELQHRHPAMPAVSAQGGHYELQTTQQWVEGRTERVWVAQTCTQRRRGTRCSGGHFRNVFQPGHYVAAQQWVFVADARPVFSGQYARHGLAGHRARSTPPLPVAPTRRGQVHQGHHGATPASVHFNRR